MNRNERWNATPITRDMSATVAQTIYRERIKHPRIDETEFLTATIELAQWHGWKVLHIREVKTKAGWETPYQGDGKGFPDLFLLRPETGHRVAAELKIEGNSASEDQQGWLDAMEACGIPAFAWYPRDVEQIEDVLAKGAAWPRDAVATDDEEAARKVLRWMLDPALPRMTEDIEACACLCASAVVRIANHQKLQGRVSC